MQEYQSRAKAARLQKMEREIECTKQDTEYKKVEQSVGVIDEEFLMTDISNEEEEMLVERLQRQKQRHSGRDRDRDGDSDRSRGRGRGRELDRDQR